jgi:hypothetical protein
MLPTVIKTAAAAVTALSLGFSSAAPAYAGKNEDNFLKGVAATLLVGAILRDAQRQRQPQPVYPQPIYPRPVYQQPVHGGGYAVPLYQTPAALAFNSYSSSERRVIQQRLAAQGYYRSGIDATFGPGTYNAVVAYARDTGNSGQLSNRAGAFGVYDSLIY